MKTSLLFLMLILALFSTFVLQQNVFAVTNSYSFQPSTVSVTQGQTSSPLNLVATKISDSGSNRDLYLRMTYPDGKHYQFNEEKYFFNAVTINDNSYEWAGSDEYGTIYVLSANTEYDPIKTIPITFKPSQTAPTGTYSLRIVDQTSSVTLATAQLIVNSASSQTPPTPTPTITPTEKKQQPTKIEKKKTETVPLKTDLKKIKPKIIKNAYLLILWNQIAANKIIKIKDYEVKILEQKTSSLSDEFIKSNDKKITKLVQNIETVKKITKVQITLTSKTLQTLQTQTELIKVRANDAKISKSEFGKISKNPLLKIKESKKISTMKDYEKAKNDAAKAKDQADKTRKDILTDLGISKADISNMVFPSTEESMESITGIKMEDACTGKSEFETTLLDMFDKGSSDKTSAAFANDLVHDDLIRSILLTNVSPGMDLVTRCSEIWNDDMINLGVGFSK